MTKAGGLLLSVFIASSMSGWSGCFYLSVWQTGVCLIYSGLTQGQGHTVRQAPLKMKLFTKEEAQQVVTDLKQVPEYIVKLLDLTHGVSSGAPLTEEGRAYAASKPKVSQFPEGKQPPEYEELGNYSHPYMQRITARKMARLLAFLKFNGGYNLITTQELGNCLWASVLRGHRG